VKSIERTIFGLFIVSAKTGRLFVTVAVSMPLDILDLCNDASLLGIGSIDTPSSSVIVSFSCPVTSFDGVIVLTQGMLSFAPDCTATLFVNTQFSCPVNGDADDDMAVTVGVVAPQADMTGLGLDRGVTGVQAGVPHRSADKPLGRGVFATI